jgi:hypothetical protein
VNSNGQSAPNKSFVNGTITIIVVVLVVFVVLIAAAVAAITILRKRQRYSKKDLLDFEKN